MIESSDAAFQASFETPRYPPFEFAFALLVALPSENRAIPPLGRLLPDFKLNVKCLTS
jgi:hypothetical protein